MIPVAPQPEPNDFDVKVRQPGSAWLAKKGLTAIAPLPTETEPPPYWRACLDELHRSYGGICAYLAYTSSARPERRQLTILLRSLPWRARPMNGSTTAWPAWQ